MAADHITVGLSRIRDLWRQNVWLVHDLLHTILFI